MVQEVSSPGNSIDDVQMNQKIWWYFSYRSNCVEVNSQAKTLAGWTRAHLQRIAASLPRFWNDWEKIIGSSVPWLGLQTKYARQCWGFASSVQKYQPWNCYHSMQSHILFIYLLAALWGLAWEHPSNGLGGWDNFGSQLKLSKCKRKKNSTPGVKFYHAWYV